MQHNISAPEEWRAIPGYEGSYSVSSLGRVRSEARQIIMKNGHPRNIRERILKPFENGEYLGVDLGNHRKYVHHLVAEAFRGPRPKGKFVCHVNDVKTDNRAENLYYGTPAENLADAIRNGVDHTPEFPGSRKGKKTCARGHEFSAENTARNTRGWRVCRTCRRITQKRRRQAAQNVE